MNCYINSNSEFRTVDFTRIFFLAAMYSVEFGTTEFGNPESRNYVITEFESVELQNYVITSIITDHYSSNFPWLFNTYFMLMMHLVSVRF